MSGTTLPESRSSSPNSKGEASRRAILDAAVSRFGSGGFRGSSVADIARDADISGTLTYAYFENKEALFLAALDDDVAALIDQGVRSILETTGDSSWRELLMASLLDAIEDHPLARRVLAGLEPKVTARMIELPALNDLRTAVAERLRSDQLAGDVRNDIDPARVASGIVSIYISLLMAVIQFGSVGLDRYGPDVMAVMAAAVDPPKR